MVESGNSIVYDYVCELMKLYVINKVQKMETHTNTQLNTHLSV